MRLKIKHNYTYVQRVQYEIIEAQLRGELVTTGSQLVRQQSAATSARDIGQSVGVLRLLVGGGRARGLLSWHCFRRGNGR